MVVECRRRRGEVDSTPMKEKQVRDEFVEHHEGQALFTARRVVFGSVLLAACFALGAWIVLSRETV